MSENLIFSTCIFCSSPVEPDSEYCPLCGLKEPTKPFTDLSTIKETKERAITSAQNEGRKFRGPFNFKFPEVVNAYVFHPETKVKPAAIFSMVLTGLVVAIIGGVVLYPVHTFVARWLVAISAQSMLWMLLGALILYPGTAALLGLLIGWSIGSVAQKSQCRFPKAIRRITFGSSVLAFLVYLLIYFSQLGFAEGLDTWIDYAKLISYIILIPVVALSTSTLSIEKTPFCETCGRFMKVIRWDSWPIQYEGALLHVVESKQYLRLTDYPLQKANEIDPKKPRPNPNKITAEYWYCEHCFSDGYLNLTTTQVRNSVDAKGQFKTETRSRRTSSQRLQKEDITVLSSLAEKI